MIHREPEYVQDAWRGPGRTTPTENFPGDLWEEGEMEIMLDVVKSECEVRRGDLQSSRHIVCPPLLLPQLPKWRNR